MLFFLRPAMFLLLVLAYYAMNWLNIVQVLKTAAVGILAILTATAWTTRNGTEGRPGRTLNLGVVSLFLLLASFQTFLRDIFGVAPDDFTVIDSLFNTSHGEASEFLMQNAPSIGRHLAICGILIGFYGLVLRFPDRAARTAGGEGDGPGKRRLLRRRRIMLWVFAGMLAVVHFNPTMRKENPLLYFPIRHAMWTERIEEMEDLQEQVNRAMASDRSFASLQYIGDGPRTVVLLIGESTTRLNWSMYGYARMTTPLLESLGDRLTRFEDVLTTWGSTVRDVQAIMGLATREHPELYSRTPDLLSMAGKTGYKTFWITNHSTDMHGALAIIANHADFTLNVNRGGSRSEGSYDEVVLPHLQTALDDPAERKFIVLHLLGAHPAFYFRYPEPFSLFDSMDDAVAEELKASGRSFRAVKMRGYYDNAMLYIDHVLKATIDLCEAREGQAIAWIFVPDHGEDVAHYNNFVGHNTRVPAMYEIPMLLWMSPSFPLELGNLPELQKRPYQTDRLDHTLLGLMGIKGDYYDSRNDILSADFQPSQRFIGKKPYP